VYSAHIYFNCEDAIMRTAQFSMKDEPIDYMSARVKPVFGLRMKNTMTWGDAYERTWQAALNDDWAPDDVWAEWPLGVFVLSSPEKVSNGETANRRIEAYDLNQLLKTDGISKRLYYAAGTRYTDVVLNVLAGAGITGASIEGASATLKTDIEYPVGTFRLDIVNDLLAAINYTPIYPDENGVFTARRKRDVELQDIAYIYSTKKDSVIMDGARENVDYFNLPNRFIAVVSSPDVAPLVSIYENNDPKSELSTVNRQTVTETRELDDISTQADLDEYVSRWAKDTEAAIHAISFSTGLMPMHGYMDVYQFEHETLRINEIYQETAWDMDCKAGGSMGHEARMIV
jgi:hypothetical protein